MRRPSWLGSSMMVESSHAVIDKARRIAAVMLDVAEGDISFADGLFMAPNSNRRLTLFDIARAAEDLPALADDLRGPRPADPSAHSARPSAWRRGPRRGPGDAGGFDLRARLRPASLRKLSRLRHAARRSLPAPRCRADGRSDRRQRAARQGRRRGRHYTELGGAHERGRRRALRPGYRAHGHAGDAAARLAGDPCRTRWFEQFSALTLRGNPVARMSEAICGSPDFAGAHPGYDSRSPLSRPNRKPRYCAAALLLFGAAADGRADAARAGRYLTMTERSSCAAALSGKRLQTSSMPNIGMPR